MHGLHLEKLEEYNMTNESKALLFHIGEELEGVESHLELEYDEESMSFNLYTKDNDVNKVRLVYDLTLGAITYTIDGEEDDGEYETAAVVSIENKSDYIVVTNNHLDIPILHGPGINYLVVPDDDLSEEHITVLNKFPVCLTSIANFELDNLSLSTTIIQLDRTKFITHVTASASLFEMALAAEKGELNGVNTINSYIHSVYKSASGEDVNKPQFGDVKPKVDTDHKETQAPVATAVHTDKEPVKHTLTSIKLEELTAEPKYQLRVREDLSAIKDLASAYEDEETVPPIEVVDTGDELIIVDGFHRYAAATEAGLDSIECLVILGTQREAFTLSLGANANNKALKRTNADKRKAVLTALTDDELKEQSNREIAVICKVSHSIVNRIRIELKEEVEEAIEPEEPITMEPSLETFSENASGNVSTSNHPSKQFTQTLSFNGSSVSIKLPPVTDENRLNEFLADIQGLIESYMSMKEEF